MLKIASVSAALLVLIASGCSGTEGTGGAQGSQGIQGEQGVPGPRGDPGSQGIPGPPGSKGLTWRGGWNDTTTYAPDDTVEYAGSAYVATTGSTGSPPPGAGWELLAAASLAQTVVVTRVVEPVTVGSVATPVDVSGIANPVAVSGIASSINVAAIETAIGVSGILSPVTVSGISAPVQVSGITNSINVAAIESAIGVSGILSPVSISGITAPVTVGSVTSPVAVSGIASSVTVASIESPVAVSGISSPVTVGSVSSPVAVSGIASSVTVGSVTNPVTVSEIVAPVQIAGPIQLAAGSVITTPDTSIDNIENGNFDQGTVITCPAGISATQCRRIVAGPLVVTDFIVAMENAFPLGEFSLLWAAATDSSSPRWRASTLPAYGMTGSTSYFVGMQAITGARLAVRAGEFLYMAKNGTTPRTITWSGYRP